jgi:membrane protease YdiL (CAAX protease family)
MLPASRDPDPESPVLHRIVALSEVLICSDFLSQVALSGTLGALGYDPHSGGRLRIGYVVGLSLTDTALLLGLIFFFLRVHGENPREVFFGRRPIAGEAARGVWLIGVALGIGILVLGGIQHFVPRLHNVAHNPLQDLLGSRRDAWLFALVVFVAGGLREELQRAFLLHRFEQWLGGGVTGLVVTSAAFGAGHLLQGVDAAIATALLGAFWAAVYLRRRSCVASIVSHSGFDLLQIAQFLVK